MPKKNSLEDLSFFWGRVEKTPSCWNWTGWCKRKGWHGTVGVSGKHWQVHRLSWTIHYGEIPDGLFVLHKCDNPKCVRPSHLFLGTQADNCRDMLTKGRQVAPSRKTSPNTKIPHNDLEKIIVRWRAGESQRAIGKSYGATDVAVSVMLKRAGVKK